MSVIIKEAMANGRLTPRNEDPVFKERLQLLCDTARQVCLATGQLAELWPQRASQKQFFTAHLYFIIVCIAD